MIILIIAISVSFDSLLLGTSLGIKKIIFPARVHFLLSFLFILYCIMGYIFAKEISRFFLSLNIPSLALDYFGNACIICLGLYYIFQTNSLEFFNHSGSGDLDNSGKIETIEALVLSFVLSIDTVIAVISTSLTSKSSFLISSIFGLIQSIFLTSGYLFGRILFGKIKIKSRFIQYVPGIVLLSVGFFKLFYEILSHK